MEKDIRWQQRFANYKTAFKKFNEGIEVVKSKLADNEKAGESRSNLDELLKDGMIHRFEYTHELAWNLMKDYAEYQGTLDILGSRDAIRTAFRLGLISDAHGWMDMLEGRRLTSHTYNKAKANEVNLKIVHAYHKLFLDFEKRMESLMTSE